MVECGEAEFLHEQFRSMTVCLLGDKELGGCCRKAFSPCWLWAGGVAEVKVGTYRRLCGRLVGGGVSTWCCTLYLPRVES